MMAVMMQLISFVSLFVSITVSDGIFKLVNSSVQLDAQTKDYEFDDFTWSFNKSKNIVKYYKSYPSNVYQDYKNRVEVNEGTQSLTVKNLQKTDSGLYEAKASGEQERIVAEYQLTVLEELHYLKYGGMLTLSIQLPDQVLQGLTVTQSKLTALGDHL
ncbi:uncharacterized protein LOC132871699 isoform X2 [Neoarius graeffei]|uniref:uncharacterized protein LOC132871699 isoform X2 n=1 Tax=Neoarius graeffei TaxID=443677 RepID=UPI00298C6E4F|nr:uncharacterized protein LOC132871699 isoform X2 [Neoarius graeffei]